MEGLNMRHAVGLMAEQGSCVMIPTTIFSGIEGLYFTLSHNDPLAVELKVANAFVGRILIDNRSSVDIITWDCLRRLKHPGREIIRGKPYRSDQAPVMARGQVYDKKSRDVPVTYNVILGWPTLHRVEAVIASYLLELQYEADDGSKTTRRLEDSPGMLPYQHSVIGGTLK
ncbi:LOW QUALITY PROTEIN: hypothetical protein Cgig2_007779 [Carnegiea gigantea]|uniref:Uncharacterized protein n=1 Tax=Carnegiea gigantea TaxID=171969 RepID=A0A9Q1K1P7_9CARY|nr:LOW QUALITY PROTEIN: hypothetical protein Cgig2_007779 [Carnegiea gigantea]